MASDIMKSLGAGIGGVVPFKNTTLKPIKDDVDPYENVFKTLSAVWPNEKLPHNEKGRYISSKQLFKLIDKKVTFQTWIRAALKGLSALEEVYLSYIVVIDGKSSSSKMETSLVHLERNGTLPFKVRDVLVTPRLAMLLVIDHKSKRFVVGDGLVDIEPSKSSPSHPSASESKLMTVKEFLDFIGLYLPQGESSLLGRIASHLSRVEHDADPKKSKSQPRPRSSVTGKYEHTHQVLIQALLLARKGMTFTTEQVGKLMQLS